MARSLKTTSNDVSDKIQLGTFTLAQLLPEAVVPVDINVDLCDVEFLLMVSSPSGSSRVSVDSSSSSTDVDWPSTPKK